ncbi:hypothetical protein [Catenuloplanes indicus]|uniref:Uncharacterized protein n=1 Tax=Catenuloplanes indicus TaxID=137267 RepID=A0AAE3VZV4_9ACTN|nr:hypothetical protein [Catenuloplanes indicus]MDQ0366367.1 hypothetical protein [Catenuloplanes indicus]
MLMNEERATRRDRKLIAAGAVTLTIAAVLIWAGWQFTGITYDWSATDDRIGVALRGAGALLIGKTGLKIGLVVVGAAIATVMWMRGRRRHH